MRKLLYVLVVLALCLPIFVPQETVSASTPYNVQRGLLEIGAGSTTNSTTLGTPVPVGKSFVLASVRGTAGQPTHVLATVVLTDVVDSKFTKVTITRTGSTGTCSVEWQVISGDDFTVQSGTTTLSATTTNVAISTVDRSKTFVTSTIRTAGTVSSQWFTRAYLTSSTNLQLYIVNRFGSTTVSWYVVEWEGATVQYGATNIANGSSVLNVAISTIDPETTVLLYNYATENPDGGYYTHSVMTRGYFTSTTNIEFRRGSTYKFVALSWFAISHPNISVQRGALNPNATTTLGTAVDTSISFAVMPQHGNGYWTTVAANSYDQTVHTHKLWQDGVDTKITLERGVNTGTFYGYWFVATISYSGAEVGTLPATAITSAVAVLWGEVEEVPELGEVVERGFVWGKVSKGDPGNTHPQDTDYDDWWTESGNWQECTFSRSISGLDETTTYYFRAAAKTDEGVWAYGGEESFVTKTPPSVTTLGSTEVKDTLATVYGEVVDVNNTNIIERGFDYGTSSGVYAHSWTRTGTWTVGVFEAQLTGLSRGVIYYYRAKAKNSDGSWGYGSELAFGTYNPSIYASCTEDDDADAEVYATTWYAQTFTPFEGFQLAAVRIKAASVNASGPLTVSIRETTALGVPRTLDLVSAVYDGLSASTDWYEVTMPTYYLEQKEYAVVVRAVAGDAGNYVKWRYATNGTCEGCYAVSVNSGTSWTLNCARSFMYEVRGHTTLRILNANVYTGYLETGDWLITVYYLNEYPPYYGTTVMSDYFALQLLVDGTPVTSTRLRQWGKMPGSIYLSKGLADTLTWGETYQIRMIGLFSPYPATYHTLIPPDWKGSDLRKLDSWVIETAKSISVEYETALVTVANKDEVLNELGSVLFKVGVPMLEQVRPHLFLFPDVQTPYSERKWTREYEDSFDYTELWGDKILDDAAAVGGMLGIAGLELLRVVFFGTWAVVGVGAVAVVGTGAIFVSMPFLIIGTLSGILPITPLALLVALIVMTLVYVIWFRGT